MPLFLGGVPTGPVVLALEEAFGDREPGDSVSYDEISDVIRTPARSSRFHVVVDAWRKSLRKNKNIATVRRAGENCVRFLRENERAGDAYRDFRSHVKGIGKAVAKVSAVRAEVLTESERQTKMHVQRIAEATYQSAKSSANEIATAFRPPAQLPRIRPDPTVRKIGMKAG